MAIQTQVAEHLDLSISYTQKLFKRGILPSSKGAGGYNLDACRVAYIRYLRGIKTGQIKPDTTDSDDGDYSRLLEKERYREKKRQNDLEENQVAPVDLLSDALVQQGNQIIPILESLPLVMKRHWPEITGDQITLVKKAIAECRNIIADSAITFE